MYVGAVVDWGGFSWRVLGLGWRRMLVFVERFLDKAWHAIVKDSCFAVPVQADAKIFASLPVDCDFVVFFYCFLEMVRVFVASKLDANVIDY